MWRDTSATFGAGNVSRLGAMPVPVRIHSECLFGDVFKSMRCDCGRQLHGFMQNVLGNEMHASGVMLYIQALLRACCMQIELGQEGNGTPGSGP